MLFFFERNDVVVLIDGKSTSAAAEERFVFGVSAERRAAWVGGKASKFLEQAVTSA
jgi:hypothetical protein